MNKNDLIRAVAVNAKLTKAQAKSAVDVAMDAVVEALQKGDKVSVSGFGTLFVQEKAARAGVNPSTGEKISIPAKKVVKFKAGADLASKIK